LPILLAFAFRVKKAAVKVALHVVFWFGTWLLILSASRTPFAAYLLGVGLVVFLLAMHQRSWLKKGLFLFSRGTVTLFFILLMFYYFGDDLSSRLDYLIKSSPKAQEVVNSLNESRKSILPDSTIASWPLSPAQLKAMLPKGKPPGNGVATDNREETKIVASASDQPPTPVVEVPKVSPKPTPVATGTAKPAGPKPADVLVDVPDQVVVATVSATGKVTYQTRQQPRVYSDCALKKELSLCIRQEVLWPRAIEGFLVNPLTGSGYATLTKESVDVFTEADSTDNNFLRTLGETGALGFITFYGTILVVLYYAFRSMKSEDLILSTLSIGLVGGIIGLLLNAAYIDVFASSKVAQSFWAICGLFFGYMYLVKQEVSVAQPVKVMSVPKAKKRTKKIK
jgi:hypothetical protein